MFLVFPMLILLFFFSFHFRVVVLDKVTDFILFLGQLTITAGLGESLSCSEVPIALQNPGERIEREIFVSGDNQSGLLYSINDL